MSFEKGIGAFRLEGSIVPMVSPAKVSRRGRTVIDTRSVGTLTEHLVKGQSRAIFALGTTGEFMDMPPDQKDVLIDTVVHETGARIPVIIGISAESLDETRRLAVFAENSGASGVVLAPLYGNGEPQKKLNTIKESTKLPIILYNNPSIHENRSLPLDFVEIASRDPQVVGMKDSSGEWSYFKELLNIKSGSTMFSIVQGRTGFILRSLQEGADGYISGSANVYPEELSEIYRGRDLNSMNKVKDLSAELRGIEDIKLALVRRGIIRSSTRFS